MRLSGALLSSTAGTSTNLRLFLGSDETLEHWNMIEQHWKNCHELRPTVWRRLGAFCLALHVPWLQTWGDAGDGR